MDPVALGVIGSAIASIMTLITIITNAIIAKKQEVRRRKWDQEDRRMQAEVAANQAAGLHKAIAENTEQTATAAQQAVTNAKITQAASVSLHKAIAENTAQTKDAAVKAQAAFDEANDVNQKLAALGIRVKKKTEVTLTIPPSTPDA